MAVEELLLALATVEPGLGDWDDEPDRQDFIQGITRLTGASLKLSDKQWDRVVWNLSFTLKLLLRNGVIEESIKVDLVKNCSSAVVAIAEDKLQGSTERVAIMMFWDEVLHSYNTDHEVRETINTEMLKHLRSGVAVLQLGALHAFVHKLSREELVDVLEDCRGHLQDPEVLASVEAGLAGSLP